VDTGTARDVLGLGRESGVQEAERAFRRLAGEHHPDRGGDPERFRQIVAARRALTAGGTSTARGSRTDAPDHRVFFVARQPLWRTVLQALRRTWSERRGDQSDRRVQ
jgi:hypothetical protein